MRRFAVFLIFAASVSVLACKEDDKPRVADDFGNSPTTGVGGGGSDGGGSEGGLDSGTDAAVVCNTLANDGNVIDQNRIVGDPPTGTGGVIADGTWALTAADLYVGAGGVPGLSGVTFQGVLRLTTGTLERVTKMTPSQASTPVETRTLGLLVSGGTTFTVTQSCPAPFQDQYTYSVVNNTLNITSLITKESFTFTLR